MDALNTLNTLDALDAPLYLLRHMIRLHARLGL